MARFHTSGRRSTRGGLVHRITSRTNGRPKHATSVAKAGVSKVSDARSFARWSPGRSGLAYSPHELVSRTSVPSGAFGMTPATNALRIAAEPSIQPFRRRGRKAARVRVKEYVAANANLRPPIGRARDNLECAVARAICHRNQQLRALRRRFRRAPFEPTVPPMRDVGVQPLDSRCGKTVEGVFMTPRSDGAFDRNAALAERRYDADGGVFITVLPAGKHVNGYADIRNAIADARSAPIRIARLMLRPTVEPKV